MGDGTYPDPRVAARPELFDAKWAQGIKGRNFADLVIAAYGRILS